VPLMSNTPKFIFSNQYAGYLFVDVVNTFARHNDCILLTGQLDEGNTKLDSNVKKVFFTRYDRTSASRRVFTWLLYTMRFFFYSLRAKKDTELFIATNPPFAPLAGYLVFRMRKLKYHLLIYDIYPEALVSLNMISRSGIVNRNWSRLNRSMLRQASSVFTLSDNMAALIKEYNAAANVQVVPNWAHTSYIKPIPKSVNSFARMYQQEGKITVMYSGNMGATHAVEKIADLAEAYRADQGFGFLLIGEGAKKPVMERRKAEKQLDNLLILPFQPVETLPFSFACADIAVVTLSQGAENLSVPSKTYNMLAAGAALLVIASPSSELAKLVAEYDCGVSFSEHEVSKMIAFLEQIKSNPQRLQEMKDNARKASHNFTSLNADKYIALINSNVPQAH
jgi:glycosyltransferase involved in cell wall biosynthesis